MDHQPRIARLELVVPSRALALWFLRHVAKPQHRLVFVDVIYRGTAEPNEFLEVAGETQSLRFRRCYRVHLFTIQACSQRQPSLPLWRFFAIKIFACPAFSE